MVNFSLAMADLALPEGCRKGQTPSDKRFFAVTLNSFQGPLPSKPGALPPQTENADGDTIFRM
jgi:hypothetical protein